MKIYHYDYRVDDGSTGDDYPPIQSAAYATNNNVTRQQVYDFLSSDLEETYPDAEITHLNITKVEKI